MTRAEWYREQAADFGDYARWWATGVSVPALQDPQEGAYLKMAYTHARRAAHFGLAALFEEMLETGIGAWV